MFPINLVLSNGEIETIDPVQFGINEQLPYGHQSYFVISDDTTFLPTSRLISQRARTKGITNSYAYMRAALDNTMSKRLPVTVKKIDGDRYEIIDGNSTFINALIAGWADIPCDVVVEL